MSATFHVFPAIDHVPTFGEVLEVAHGHLSAFLRTCDIHYPVRFDVGLRDSEKRAQAIDLHGPARWPEDQCAWFHVPGVNGGAAVFNRPLDEVDRSILKNEIRSGKNAEFNCVMQQSLQVGRCWAIFRSSGQPAIIDVGHGFLAAALAELTEGFLHSVDSAWGYKLLPARPDDFLRWYFRPELPINAPNREWAEQCIASLEREVRSATMAQAA